jgi:hypothetical protein
MNNIFHRLSSLGLAAVLAFGVFVVWLFAFGMIYVPIEQYLQKDAQNESMLVLLDGTPVIRNNSSSRSSYQYRSLDGKALEELDHRTRTLDGVWLPGPSWKESEWRGIPWRQRFIYVTDYNWRRQNEKWYYVHDGKLDGRGYFAGYDAVSRQCLGYIGKNGFQESEPSEKEGFPMDGRLMLDPRGNIIAQMLTRTLPPSLGGHPAAAPSFLSLLGLLTNEGLYVINPEERTSKWILEDDDLCSIGTTYDPYPPISLATKSDSRQTHISRGVLFVRQSNRVCLLDDEGKQTRTYELPPEIQNIGFQWYELGDGKALVMFPPYGHTGMGGNYQVYWLENGHDVRHQEVLLNGPHRPHMHPESAIGAPSPILIFLLGSGILEDISPSMASLAKSLKEGWVGYSILGIACIVLAWLCCRRQRNFGLPWTGAWVAFVLLFGVPGYLGYLAHRRWPALLPCPHCGQNAPRDRSACLHCRRDFPAPELTGTEVFLHG